MSTSISAGGRLALAYAQPTLRRLNPIFLRNTLTCVGLRLIPVSSSIALTASFMLSGGFFSK